MSTADAAAGLLIRYEVWMRSAGFSPRTIHQRAGRARHILNSWPDPAQPSSGDVAEYLGERDDLAPWSRATYYNDTRAFFRWLTAAGLIDTDPMVSDLIRRPKASGGIPKPLSRDEEARAVAAARGDMRGYLLLALRAGLRASEIAAFRGEEINEDFIILIGKGSKEASIPTHPELWQLAQEYPRRGWWFPSAYVPGRPVRGSTVGQSIARLFRRTDVDIPAGSIHRCRHSFATNLLRSGANIREVQQLMRHADLNTTAVYTAVQGDELRTAVGRLGSAELRGNHLRMVR